MNLEKGHVTFLLLVFITPLFATAQSYLKPNEKVVLSFLTKNDKQVEVAIDTSQKYLVYRQGSGDMVDYEFPGNLDESWDVFEYSWYLRGGGLMNEGTDLNYLYFENGDSKYVVYEVYTARTDETKYGVKIFNLTSGEKTEWIGFQKTVKGSLIDLRKNEKVKIGQEMFD